MVLEINGERVSPLEYAKSIKPSELKRVVKTIRSADYDEFSDRCRICFEKYLAKEYDQAKWWSNHAMSVWE